AAIALDPGEGVLLADRDQHVVARKVLIRLASVDQLAAALGVAFGLDLLEGDAGELTVVVGEFLRHQEIMDRDALVHGVFLFPRRRLHFLETRAHHDLHFFAAEPARGAAAVHGGVAAAQHDHALADFDDVAERHGREPIDADVNVLRRFLAAGNIEVAPARRAGADEDRVPTFGEQRLHAVDTLAAAEFDAEAEDVAGLLVDHAVRQAEFRNLRADHAAGLRIAVEHHHVVTERRQIARDRERGRPAADQGDALAVFLLRGLRQPRGNVVLVIGGDALQAADCHWLVLDADAAAGRFARAVAGASENSGKYVRMPVDHVSVGVTARRDQPDIFRDGRVRRTRPLAIHDLVE